MFNQMMQGQVALITGGTRGIGKAIAKAFISQGAKVILFGMDRMRGEKAARELGDQAVFDQVDVSKTEEVKEAIQKIIETHSKIDLLVNNAGITRDKLLLRMDEEDWDNVMDVNVKSCYNVSRFVAKAMIKARSGKILNISSIIGLTGNAGQVNYAASKAAMIGFTKALAKELASRGITVNCIAPGFIATEMTDKLGEAQKKEIVERIPLKRIGTAEDVANLALFLASRLADYITGQVVVIDGGIIV